MIDPTIVINSDVRVTSEHHNRWIANVDFSKDVNECIY